MNNLTPAIEDYLERITQLEKKQGYVRAVDLAEELGVSAAGVTQTLKKMEVMELVKLQKYRGFSLTTKGKTIGLAIRKRHLILAEFFGLLKLPANVIEKDIEGIEHHLSNTTLKAIEKILPILKKCLAK